MLGHTVALPEKLEPKHYTLYMYVRTYDNIIIIMCWNVGVVWNIYCDMGCRGNECGYVWDSSQHCSERNCYWAVDVPHRAGRGVPGGCRATRLGPVAMADTGELGLWLWTAYIRPLHLGFLPPLTSQHRCVQYQSSLQGTRKWCMSESLLQGLVGSAIGTKGWLILKWHCLMLITILEWQN